MDKLLSDQVPVCVLIYMCYPGHGDCVTCLMVAVVVRVSDSQPYVLGQASLSKMSNSQLINGILTILLNN